MFVSTAIIRPGPRRWPPARQARKSWWRLRRGRKTHRAGESARPVSASVQLPHVALPPPSDERKLLATRRARAPLQKESRQSPRWSSCSHTSIFIGMGIWAATSCAPAVMTGCQDNPAAASQVNQHGICHELKSHLPLNGAGFEMAADRLSHLLLKLAKICALRSDSAESRGGIPRRDQHSGFLARPDLKDDFVHALTVRVDRAPRQRGPSPFSRNIPAPGA